MEQLKDQTPVYESTRQVLAADNVLEDLYELPSSPTEAVPIDDGRINGMLALGPAPEQTYTAPTATESNGSPWKAPDPSTRGMYASELQDVASAEYSSKLARGIDRISRFFSKSAEITEKGSELARRFGGFAGRTALRGQVAFNLIGEDRPSDKPRQTVSGLLRKGLYNATTLKSDRDTSSFSDSLPYGGKYSHFGKWINEEVVKPGAAAAGQAVKNQGRSLVDNTHELRTENIRMKSSLKRIEAELHDKGLDAQGRPVEKDLSKKADKKRYQSEKLSLKADYKEAKRKKTSA